MAIGNGRGDENKVRILKQYRLRPSGAYHSSQWSIRPVLLWRAHR